jgi:hypothetical protein
MIKITNKWVQPGRYAVRTSSMNFSGLTTELELEKCLVPKLSGLGMPTLSRSQTLFGNAYPKALLYPCHTKLSLGARKC